MERRHLQTSKLWWKLVAWSVVSCCAGGIGCSKKSEGEQAAATAQQEPAPSPPPAEPAAPQGAVPGPGAVEAKASGTITLSPNPVPICDKTGVGVATVHWTVEGAKNVEVRLDKPDGTLFAADDHKEGSASTGPWVKKNTTLYLQDVDNNHSRDANFTLAKVTAEVVGGGPCP